MGRAGQVTDPVLVEFDEVDADLSQETWSKRGGEYAQNRLGFAHRIVALRIARSREERPRRFRVSFKDGNPLNCRRSNVIYTCPADEAVAAPPPATSPPKTTATSAPV